jgi:hypothetical protein
MTALPEAHSEVLPKSPSIYSCKGRVTTRVMAHCHAMAQPFAEDFCGFVQSRLTTPNSAGINLV